MCNFKQLRAKHVYIGLVRRKLLFQLRPTLVMFLAQGLLNTELDFSAVHQHDQLPL